MNENTPIRPTKKQRELLAFIEKFIGEHGYSPSYREIMQGLEYNSVATVALHINNLVKRGHIKRRDGSARSLEIANALPIVPTNAVKPGEEKWLIEKVEYFFTQAESTGEIDPVTLSHLQTLLNTLKILGIDGGAQSFATRLTALRKLPQRPDVQP